VKAVPPEALASLASMGEDPSMTIEAVGLDIGRVVLDFDFAPLLAKVAPLTRLSVEEIVTWFRKAELQEAFETGRISPEDFVREVKEALLLDMTDRDFVEAWNSIFTETEGMESLLGELSPRIPLIAGTNTNALHLAHIRTNHAALSRFDDVVASCEIGHRKPESAFYRELVSRAGVSPERLFFADDLEANVAGAKAVGLQAILFEGAGPLREHLESLGCLS
jgi:putative hydrolase of the HAD superfamily